MAKNTSYPRTTQKPLFFPTLVSSAYELYSFDSETHKYTLKKSTIEQVLSSVEEKNKSLKVATVGIIASRNNDNHKVYTDLLIQYLEHRLRTNEKLVEKFIKEFDERSTRITSFSNCVYFWPKIYTITSKKKERCRLLILFFDGTSNKTLDIVASAICSQIYVFKEVGKNILVSELQNLRESFTKTSNVTLRNPCTTVIKSENDPPRSFRMFLKDWVDFRLDFFKNKETMYNDWEQLMRYLVKTESAINAYIRRTELRLISSIPVVPSTKKSSLGEKTDTEPVLRKVIQKGQPLPGLIPDQLSKPDPPKKPTQNLPLRPASNVLDNKVQSPQKPVPATHVVVQEQVTTPIRYHPISTEDLIGTIKALIYTWIAKKLNISNIDSMLDCCKDLMSFDKNGLFDELTHLKFTIHTYNCELSNMFDHHVSFQLNEKDSVFQQKCKDVQQNLYKTLQEKCTNNLELIRYLFQHACIEINYQYRKDNELIILHETNYSKRVSDKAYDMYRDKLGQNVNRYQFYEQAVAYHEKLKTYCSRLFARCLDYDSRHNHVMNNESILLTKTLDHYFKLVCEGIPWIQSRPSSVSKDNVTVPKTSRQIGKVENTVIESDNDLRNMKKLLISQCASIMNQLNNREVILRPLSRKVIEESVKRAQDIANDKHTTKEILISEMSELNELVLEYNFKKI